MKILLAEDEHELSRALTVILEHEGYDVCLAEDGVDALFQAKNNDFDAYVFDIMMPRMDGITVIESLRAGGDKTPALFLTAKSTTEDTVRGLDAGADDYLTKPFAMGEFLARVRVLLRRSEDTKTNETLLTWGNLSLDQNQKMLESPSMRLALAPDEARVLALLIEYNGKPLSHRELAETLFNSNNVDTLFLYLDYLEQKLRFADADGELVRRDGQVWLARISQ